MSPTHRSIAFGALLALAPAPALADAPSAADRARAIDRYEAGRSAFLAGDFEAARASFAEAYRLDPSPILVYNLGRASEELGDHVAAVEHYRVYLARDHQATDREEVIARIARLEGLAEPAPSANPALRADAAAASPEPSLYPYAAVAGGLGLAGVAAGVYFGLESNRAAERHRDAQDGGTLRGTWDEAHTQAERANIALGVGGGLLAVGATLALIEVFDDDVSITAVPQAGGPGVGVAARF
ncbi:MAG: hypothetical protein H6704_07900 [Myxococcales bacterium]|nr:hypothetical protein [Myxococcales bacterium]